MEELIPPHISLEPSTQALDAELVGYCDALENAGFELCGHFEIPEFSHMPVAGLTRVGDGVMAAVYEHPLVGIWIDFCLLYQDGETLTASNAPTGSELDQRPGHAKVFSETWRYEELLQLLVDNRKDKPFTSVSPESFKKVYEQLYADDAAWRNEKGVDPDEIARMAEVMNEDISEYAIQRTAKRYGDLQLTEEEAWDVLNSWPELEEEADVPEELFDRFENAADYFIRNPNKDCLPLFLGSLREEDEGLAMFVTEVFEEHAESECVDALAKALESDSIGTRTWATDLACSFPAAKLTASLIRMLDQTPPLDPIFQNALMALESSEDDRASAAIAGAVERAASIAEELFSAGEATPAFLILLSTLKHHQPTHTELFAKTIDAAQEEGFPAREMAEMHKQTLDMLKHTLEEQGMPVQ